MSENEEKVGCLLLHSTGLPGVCWAMGLTVRWLPWASPTGGRTALTPAWPGLLQRLCPEQPQLGPPQPGPRLTLMLLTMAAALLSAASGFPMR